MLKSLIVDHCLGDMVNQDPLLAEEMATSAMQAFCDNWHVMERPGYECQTFREALDAYAEVLTKARPLLTPTKVETIVSMLESIEASVRGYELHLRSDYDSCVIQTTGRGKENPSEWAQKEYKVPRKAGENAIETTIKVVMPAYNRATREKKKGKPLDCEVACWSSFVMTS